MAKLKNVLINIALLVIAILLFALPHPTDFFLNGMPILSYFAFIPLFILIQRISWKTVLLYGFIYGVCCYSVFTSWLITFNPIAMPIIAGMYGLYLMITFVLLKSASVLFPKHSTYAQWIVWCAYEYIKTLGFTGFNYGVTAYSQWKWPIIIQCASLIGVFGLSAIITFFSAWVSAIILDPSKKIIDKIFNHKIAGISWIAVFSLVVIYGIVSPVDYSKEEVKTIALIQNNTDPWVGGVSSYEFDLKILQKLSDQALETNKNIDLVVWPETSFVPRIKYIYQNREDRKRFNLVNNLLTYIDSKSVPFIIGSDDGVMGYSASGKYELLDYNATFLFVPGENVIPPEPETYRKMHLVPFTEYFPFENILPSVYNTLVELDVHLWEKGTDPVVFDLNGFKFGTPICFEDTFGYIGRRYVNNGAQALINLSNDAWSKSEACQYQHLAMAVFRSVENRVPSARATSSGQTVFIDPNGIVTEMATPFTEKYLVGTIPVRDINKKTLYTLWGDYVGLFFSILALFVLVGGYVFKIIRKRKNGKK